MAQATQTTPRRLALAAVYAERYGLSVVFLCLAGFRLHGLLDPSPEMHAAIQASPVVGIIRELVWFQLYVYFGLLLLLGRRVMEPPHNIRDILIPLSTTFFYLAYGLIPWLPPLLKQSFCPAGWQQNCAVAGSVLNLIGLWINIWAAVYLGRSFGVLVEVRKVVLDGPYRWVRHPMYSGYVFFLAGFALANFSPACFILVPAHVALLLYRARLEESRLAEFSPAYQEYRERTGMIFPRFGRAE